MAATVAHCQQLIDKLRVLSASDDAAKMEQVRLRARAQEKQFGSELVTTSSGAKNSRAAQGCDDFNPVFVRGALRRRVARALRAGNANYS